MKSFAVGIVWHNKNAVLRVFDQIFENIDSNQNTHTKQGLVYQILLTDISNRYTAKKVRDHFARSFENHYTVMSTKDFIEIDTD